VDLPVAMEPVRPIISIWAVFSVKRTRSSIGYYVGARIERRRGDSIQTAEADIDGECWSSCKFPRSVVDVPVPVSLGIATSNITALVHFLICTWTPYFKIKFSAQMKYRT
jgi:hypothetical protein